jgi:predicted methyltransferase
MPARLFLTVFALCVGLPACSPSAQTADTATPPAAEPAAVPADINTRFLDPEIDAEDWAERWEVESREIYARRHEIVEAIGLVEGESIADVGAGTGLFVAPFSAAVAGTGTVYALDISPAFVEHVRRRARDEGLANVEVVLSEQASTTLPGDSVDVVFLCDTYHHFEHHVEMLASIRDALRPGGRLVVVDFERIPGVSRDWILGHVRAGKDDVIAEIEQAGFRLEREVEIDGLDENYLLRFDRP